MTLLCQCAALSTGLWRSRRWFVGGGLSIVEWCVTSFHPVSAACEAWDPTTARSITLPLVACGSTFCLDRYSIDGYAIQGAIIDTGSPFLNARATAEVTEAFADTDELFAGSSGVVRWRRGQLELASSTVSLRTTAVYGVPDASLLESRRGGLFFGLVKRRKPNIRPTLLEQLGTIRAFEITLPADTPASLTLSRDPLISRFEPAALRLVDLRSWGAPVQFYAAPVAALCANGRDVQGLKKQVVAIFDTGLTVRT